MGWGKWQQHYHSPFLVLIMCLLHSGPTCCHRTLPFKVHCTIIAWRFEIPVSGIVCGCCLLFMFTDSIHLKNIICYKATLYTKVLFTCFSILNDWNCNYIIKINYSYDTKHKSFRSIWKFKYKFSLSPNAWPIFQRQMIVMASWVLLFAIFMYGYICEDVSVMFFTAVFQYYVEKHCILHKYFRKKLCHLATFDFTYRHLENIYMLSSLQSIYLHNSALFECPLTTVSNFINISLSFPLIYKCLLGFSFNFPPFVIL